MVRVARRASRFLLTAQSEPARPRDKPFTSGRIIAGPLPIES